MQYVAEAWAWIKVVEPAWVSAGASLVAAIFASALVVRWYLLRRDLRGSGAAIIALLAISEFPKWRKYLISLSFRGQSSVRPVQVGGFDVNIVIHRSTAVRGRGGPARHDAWPPSLGAILAHTDGPCGSCRRRGRTERAHRAVENAQRFPRASTGPFPSNHPRKTPKGPKIALETPDRPLFLWWWCYPDRVDPSVEWMRRRTVSRIILPSIRFGPTC